MHRRESLISPRDTWAFFYHLNVEWLFFTHTPINFFCSIPNAAVLTGPWEAISSRPLTCS